jgi:hypothetical protein
MPPRRRKPQAKDQPKPAPSQLEKVLRSRWFWLWAALLLVLLVFAAVRIVSQTPSQQVSFGGGLRQPNPVVRPRPPRPAGAAEGAVRVPSSSENGDDAARERRAGDGDDSDEDARSLLEEITGQGSAEDRAAEFRKKMEGLDVEQLLAMLHSANGRPDLVDDELRPIDYVEEEIVGRPADEL